MFILIFALEDKQIFLVDESWKMRLLRVSFCVNQHKSCIMSYYALRTHYTPVLQCNYCTRTNVKSLCALLFRWSPSLKRAEVVVGGAQVIHVHPEFLNEGKGADALPVPLQGFSDFLMWANHV